MVKLLFFRFRVTNSKLKNINYFEIIKGGMLKEKITEGTAKGGATTCRSI